YDIGKFGITFKPGILAEHMAKNEHVIFAAEDYMRYEDGVYRKMGTKDAQAMVQQKMVSSLCKASQITDAETQWKLKILKDSKDINPNKYLINLRNGFYDLLSDKMTPHDPKILSTIRINAEYTPGAKCPRFMEYLQDSLPEDQIPLVQEMLGYFLVPVTSAQKSFVIVGKAGSGKSRLLLVLNEILLGKENVSNVTWQSLGERFKTAELHGKLANIFADLPTKNIDDNGIFKAIVGEDYMTAEKKNRDPFSFSATARLLFSCNSIPRNYGDRSEGFYRRLVIIRFPNAVQESKKDETLMEKFRAETNGIFMFALEGLKRLMSKNWRFSLTETNIQELQNYREENNSVLSFIKECVRQEDNHAVPSAELYQSYKTFCEKGGLTPFSQRSFIHEFK
ncbi:MAG: hypothetical protein HUK24_02860, partial [Sphaerochaetaceae bacterium]|nr:hypothetical protein [Sphaerochaetaceae bacterium]